MADILTDEQVRETEVAARCGEHTRPFDVLNLIANLRRVQESLKQSQEAHFTDVKAFIKLKQENARLRETLERIDKHKPVLKGVVIWTDYEESYEQVKGIAHQALATEGETDE